MSEYDRSFHYLNLNINSESENEYKWYPVLKDNRLAEACLQMLFQLSGMERESSFLSSENVLLSQGSTEAIDLIIRAFCEPKEDTITVTNPSFSYYSHRARIENVSVFDVPLEGEHLNRLNVAKLLSNPTKVLFLCSPNNPVGTVLDPREVGELIRLYPGIVVLDEAYIEWSEMPSFFRWTEQYDNLLILRTFSKIWGLAGVRCGITIGSKNAIETLSLVQPMFSFPDTSARVIFDSVKDVRLIFQYRSQMKHLRSDYFSFLSELKCVEKVYPGQANFLFVQFRDQCKVQEELLKEKILVSDTAHLYPGTLRISLGLHDEMEKLKSVLQKLE